MNHVKVVDHVHVALCRRRQRQRQPIEQAQCRRLTLLQEGCELQSTQLRTKRLLESGYRGKELSESTRHLAQRRWDERSVAEGETGRT